MKNPKKRQTASRTVIDLSSSLAGRILRGEWAEGEKISAERDLCRQLGVARPSLREALKALEVMGVLETRVGDGTYVARRSSFFARPLLWAVAGARPDELAQLMETRNFLEVELAGLAAEHATDAGLAQISASLEAMSKAKKSAPEFLRTDSDFRLAIGRASSNSVLSQALELTLNLLTERNRSTLSGAATRDKLCAQSRRISEAIRSGDRSRARKEMRRQLQVLADAAPLSKSSSRRQKKR